MTIKIQQKYFLFLLLLIPIWSSAQKLTIQGKVTDAESKTGLSDVNVVVHRTGKFVATGADGSFLVEGLKSGTYTVSFSHAGYMPQERNVELKKGKQAVMSIALKKEVPASTSDDFPTFSLDNDEDGGDDNGGDVSSLLRSGRDVFQNVAGFNFFSFRFSERGLNNEGNIILLNGAPVLNDAESGWATFSDIGGLNDVLRNRQATVGLDPAEFTFGDIGGASNIDTRASVQRKTTRISYANSNRSYRNRIMATYNTGLLPKGWAFSASVSRRWAQEGYVEGTFYDAYSYFVGIDKKFGTVHSLSYNFMGAPQKRGRAGDAFQEQYDISGSNYYNPLWGWQSGEKRNASVVNIHQPIHILRYDFTPSQKTLVTASSWLQSGRRGLTRLEWGNAGNPNADYNRNLPSSQPDSASAAQLAQYWRDHPEAMQINWHQLYETNSRNIQTVNNADGTGESVSGKRAVYIVEDQRSDATEAGININARHTLSQRISLQGGAMYHYYKGQNFRIVEDLLGADYWLDYDKYALQYYPDNPAAQNFDLNTPNNVVRKGEKFGYDYDEHLRRTQGWLQGQFVTKKVDFFLAGQLMQSSMWRDGKMINGKFPDNSFGESEKLDFLNHTLKGGAVYKINGRNYLYASGLIGTKAPFMNDLLIQPRQNNRIVTNPQSSTIQSIEGGYRLQAPNLRARVTGYVIDIGDETDLRTYFAQTAGTFGSVLMTGIDRRHTGVEMAVEYIATPALTLVAAANLSKNYYTNRPKMFLSADTDANLVYDGITVYQKNYFVPRSPQSVATFQIKYQLPKFAFANLSFNYADNLWYSFDPVRRNAQFVETVEYNSAAWNTILDQEKAPAAFTVDFNGGKSWKLSSGKFLMLNIGVNNLLNNKNIINGGRDAYQSSFKDIEDTRLYSRELTYALGINYFAGLTLRM